MAKLQTPFGFHSTAQEVLQGVDLTGKRIVVTGANSGIGVETARALAGAGARVTLAVRDPAAGETVAAGIRTGAAQVEVRRLDLADARSIEAFVAGWTGPLDVLVNNAGIMALPELTRTAEGREQQFATNFLGHFALTLGLERALAAANGARVVMLSSSAHMFSPVLFDDLDFNFLPYEPFVAYGQSKTAMILAAVELTRRWTDRGVVANALNPGAIPTNLQKHTGAMKTPPERRKTVQEGAATSALLAASPLVAGVGGRYFEDCNEGPLVPHRPTDFTGGVAAYALDGANAERLWEVASGLVGRPV